MDLKDIKDSIYQKYIVPTKRKKTELIGIEIEMPVATLDNSPTRHDVCQEAFSASFEPFRFDNVIID